GKRFGFRRDSLGFFRHFPGSGLFDFSFGFRGAFGLGCHGRRFGRNAFGFRLCLDRLSRRELCLRRFVDQSFGLGGGLLRLLLGLGELIGYLLQFRIQVSQRLVRGILRIGRRRKRLLFLFQGLFRCGEGFRYFRQPFRFGFLLLFGVL